MPRTADVPEVRFEAIHCTLVIRRVAPGVVVVVFTGADVGEFGERPFEELAKDLEGGCPLELFVDARGVPGASIEVSGDWAAWLQRNRTQIHRVSILCATAFVQITARFVQRFSGLEDRMRICTDAKAFDRAVEAASG